MPLQRRLPKRGFSPYKRVEYQPVNVHALERVEGGEANPETMKAAGLIGSLRRPVKILGNGEISRPTHSAARPVKRSRRLAAR